MTDKELQFAIDSGIIDVATIQEQFDMAKREENLSKHKYEIWKGKNGCWYTNLPDNTKPNKRRQIKRKTKKEVEDVIVDYYENIDKYTIDRLFHEWNDSRLNKGKITQSTHTRNNTIYNTHLSKHGYIRVEDVDSLMITEFLENEVFSKHLKKKAFLNLKGLIKGMCLYARRKRIKIIDFEGAFLDLDLADKDFDRTEKRNWQTQVFNEEELPLVMEYLEKNLYDIRNVAMLLLLISGLRVGEVCVLQFDDWENPVTINITKTETKYKDSKGKVHYEVKPTPKTYAGIRQVVIPSKYNYIYNILRNKAADSKFCFDDGKGGFIHDYVIRTWFYRVCDILDLPRRSPHDARRTYATMLLNNNVNEMFIVDQLGHTNISTTKNYYYRDMRNVSSKLKIVDNLDF